MWQRNAESQIRLIARCVGGRKEGRMDGCTQQFDDSKWPRPHLGIIVCTKT